MTLRKFVRANVAGTILAAAIVATIASSPASAQSIFFDWGSNETVNDSGREIVAFDPKARQGELIVSFGDRRVYYIVGPGKALSYPIAVPREKSKWEGVTSVSQKRVSPSWTPTPEMIRENPRLPPWVPGGHPMNPLGTHALYLGSSSYRIHGTDAPWTIGTAASKGCVRMYNKDVQDLYPRVPVGTKVTVTYKTYTTSPLDSSTAKGMLADLDKGRKLKPSENVADSAAEATKKWRDGDNAEPQKASVRSSGDNDADSTSGSSVAAAADDAADDAAGKDNDTPRARVVSTGKAQSGWTYPENKKTADDATDATAQEPLPPGDDEPVKKHASDKKAVETGSVEPAGDGIKKSKPGSTERKSTEGTEGDSAADVQPSPKERAERKEKSASTEHKAEKSEDAAAIATRALAAAERAAAAAERAADAAERASMAAVKATARADASPAPEKSAEAAPMSEWPVVKSATP